MSNQVWFITGASRGLGLALAEEALAAGKRVVATARRTETLSGLVDTYGDRVLPVALDVTDQALAEGAVRRAVERFGRIDVVVNNAGYANMAPVEEVTMDDFRAQVEAVFFGTVLVTKAALPVLRRQGSGHVIQVASVGGRITAPGLGAYQSAKFAVEGFSGVLRQEVASLGIKVTVAEPGGMRTDWAGSSMEVPSFDDVYRPTVGAMAERVRAGSGKEPIDPVKAARALIDIADEDEPPLHLLLGSDALQYATAELERTGAEDKRWAHVGSSVDFEDRQEG
ncbi:oxidoreductase [Streptomyces sp. NPDC102274]|uniref:oxidoreductase n=1 Tax=Streptomyces sp. NPDC102274 TaxID=3366151 RepID=UPI0038182044